MEIKNKIQAQRDFFIAGKTRSINYRRKCLIKLRSEIKTRQEDIKDAIEADFGKPRFETLTNEILVTLQELNFAIRNLKKWARPKKVYSGILNIPSSGSVIDEPFGVTLIISPWNFPFNLCLAPIIGAVSAGNCAVVKPSELTPNISNLIKEIVEVCFDENHVRVEQGGKDLGEELIRQKFDFIFFTGSPRVGKLVAEAASENLVPMVLELGGKSPCIVHYDSNLKVSAKRIAWGKFINAGQTCVAPDYILVHEKVKDQLVNELKGWFEKFLGEDRSQPYSNIVNENAYKRLIELRDRNEVIYGGKSDDQLNRLEPTIIEVNDLDSPVMQEEIFGPILPVLTYKNLEGALEKVRSKPRPMVLYFFSKSKRLQRIAMENIPSGDVYFNDTVMHFASPRIPVGGIGNSGMGKYHGKQSFISFSHTRSVIRKNQGIEFPFRYPPYSKWNGLIQRWVDWIH